ncbi:MFS transporter [Promicromonospora panici]|uniref:MFS transporter n=1 Tax=Promicromonospora panici TaxID=2219658 RepID=UPI001A934E3B|nr:MFS transporter [Promicromonospora panici]
MRAVRRGLVLVGILAIAANLRAALTVVGPVADDVASDLGLAASQVSLLVSLPLLCFGAFAVLAPRLSARWGFEATSMIALTALGVGIVARSLPWAGALWAGTLLVGAGIATLNVALPALVKRDFPNMVGRVTGAYSATQSAFAAVAAVVAVPLAGTQPSGWRLAFGVWVGLTLVALGLVAPQLRGAPRPRAVATAPVEGVEGVEGRVPWRSALGWQVACYMGLQSTFYYSVITWWPSVETAAGFAPGDAGAHQGVLQVVGIAASLVAGRLIDRSRARGQSMLVAAFSGLSVVAVVGELLAPGWWVVWIVLLGAGTASVFVTALSFFGLRTESHAQAAALSGMAQAFGYGLAALGPLLIGALHDVTLGWSVPLFVLLAMKVPEIALGMLAGRNRVIGTG